MKIKRKNGVFYTPADLADYLTKPLVESTDLSILDPAYGEGSLLLSAERTLKAIGSTKPSKLFGCDIRPVNGLLKHLPEANLQKLDFFDYPYAIKHDLILTNPPYVRHHYQDNKKITAYRKNLESLNILSNTADLWAFFLVKCVNHLKTGGKMGAILPWAFLQADYAQPIRNWLHANFGEIRVLALTDKFFEDAEERVVLVWLNGYGKNCTKIEMGFAQKLSDNIDYQTLSTDRWVANKVQPNALITSDQLLANARLLGYQELKEVAEVKIGIVTGAVEYFIMPTINAKSLGFSRKDLLPIISSVRELAEYNQNGTRNLDRLILFKTRNRKTNKYLKWGGEKKFNKRRHSQLRTPWYKVKLGKIPDAFFPYRVSKLPFFSLNESNIQSTNSIHRIYFKEVTPTQKKWIVLSILSSISQLSIENGSKTYGRGMLKLEPTSLHNALVLAKNDRSIDAVFLKFYAQIRNNNREAAMKIATNFINESLKIPTDISELFQSALEHLQSTRKL